MSGCGWSPEAEDAAVQATNTDATECKRSAVARGYYQDEFVAHFARRQERKPPEINRGYFARVRAIDIFIDHFLELCGSECQIINLGCGFDTLFWRLSESSRAFANFVELDHPGVVAHKMAVIRRTPALLRPLGALQAARGALHSARYHLLAADLRCPAAVRAALQRAGALPAGAGGAGAGPPPTLLLAECVLVYLPPEAAAGLLAELAAAFPTSMVLLYEQCNLDDKFGEVMLRNLAARGCGLAGAGALGAARRGSDAAAARLRAAGWPHARAWDMAAVWAALPPAERARAERLEPLDEAELLAQLHAHYALAVAARGGPLRALGLPGADLAALLAPPAPAPSGADLAAPPAPPSD